MNNRLRPFELAALGTIVLAIVVQGFFMYRLVPTLEGMSWGFGMALSLPLRSYLKVVRVATYWIPIVMLAWAALQISGRAVPVAIRGIVLCVLAAIAGATSVAGPYLMAEEGLAHAMRLTISGPSGVVDHDLVTLQLASGDPSAVIATLDPQGDRDDFVDPPRWISPGQAFQLAEAYRAQGNLAAARRLYARAQEAAVKFDEVLTPQQVAREAKWAAQFGDDVVDWAPETSRVRQLPVLIRTVSKQRLEQLDGKP